MVAFVASGCLAPNPTPTKIVVTPFLRNTSPPVTALPENKLSSTEGFQEMDLGDGITRYLLLEDGFSIDLSSDWVVVDLTDADFQEDIKSIIEQNRHLEELLNDKYLEDRFLYIGNRFNRGAKLYAVHKSFRPDLNPVALTISIIVQDFPYDVHVEEAGVIMADQLAKDYPLHAPVEIESVKLGDVNAVALTFLFEVFSNGNEIKTIINRQYIVLREDKMILVIVGMNEQYAELYMPASILEAETFRLIP
jgi:hypothetical protein